jgi:hypothetical protein
MIALFKVPLLLNTVIACVVVDLCRDCIAACMHGSGFTTGFIVKGLVANVTFEIRNDRVFGCV